MVNYLMSESLVFLVVLQGKIKLKIHVYSRLIPIPSNISNGILDAAFPDCDSVTLRDYLVCH